VTQLADRPLDLSSSPSAVSLRIPCLPEFVSVARLTVLGIASRMPFSYNEVEDLRLAVGEACTHAVERAQAYSTLPGRHAGAYALVIESSMDTVALMIDVRDNIPVDSENSPLNADEQIRHTLGTVLLELLVDEVTVDSGTSGTLVHMVKYAPTV
jgi:serine/threonine-protein kinase RsbW